MGSLFGGLFGGGDDNESNEQAFELAQQILGVGQNYWNNYVQLALQAFPANYQTAQNTLQHALQETGVDPLDSLASAISAYEGGLAQSRKYLDTIMPTAEIYLNRGLEGLEESLSPIISAGDTARQQYMDIATGKTPVTSTQYYKDRSSGTIAEAQAAASAVGNLQSGGATAELEQLLAQDADSVYTMLLSGLQSPMTYGNQARTLYGQSTNEMNQNMTNLYSAIAKQKAADQMNASSAIGGLMGNAATTQQYSVLPQLYQSLAALQGGYASQFAQALQPSSQVGAYSGLLGGLGNIASNTTQGNIAQTGLNASLGSELIGGALGLLFA